MKILSRFASVILWGLAVFAILVGALGVASFLGFTRLATVTDGASAPVAFEGSLAVAIQKPSSEVQLGDFLLVGAHSSGGSTLGEVIALDKTSDGGVSVMLKAPGLTMPDEWSYELGSYTYQQQFAVPFIGYPLAWLEKYQIPVVTVVLAGILTIGLLVIYRRTLFHRPPKDETRWFAKLDSPSTEEDMNRLSEIFVAAGAAAPEVIVKEDTSWTRRRRA